MPGAPSEVAKSGSFSPRRFISSKVSSLEPAIIGSSTRRPRGCQLPPLAINEPRTTQLKSLIFLASFCQINLHHRTIVLDCMPARCIERSNCKLASRKGAPLIAIKCLELASVIRQNYCHFEWALGLRLDKFEQICGQWLICSEGSGKMEDGSELLLHYCGRSIVGIAEFF